MQQPSPRWGQLKDLVRLPSGRRFSEIKRIFKSRSRRTLNKIVFSYLAPGLNRSGLPYAIGYKPDSHIDSGHFPEYSRFFELWTYHNSVNNCGDIARFYAFFLNVNHVLQGGIPGDLVELGVYRGNSAAMLAALARDHGRHVYLFDTFTGFDERDLRGVDAGRKHRGFEDTSVEALMRLVGTDSVTCIQGFFPDSLAKVTLPAQIAVVHIDCDLYEPMKAGLEIFYPLVSPGGILILHDYSSGQWLGTTQAVDEFFADRPEKPILIPDKSGSAIVRKSMR